MRLCAFWRGTIGIVDVLGTVLLSDYLSRFLSTGYDGSFGGCVGRVAEVDSLVTDMRVRSGYTMEKE